MTNLKNQNKSKKKSSKNDKLSQRSKKKSLSLTRTKSKSLNKKHKNKKQKGGARDLIPQIDILGGDKELKWKNLNEKEGVDGFPKECIIL